MKKNAFAIVLIVLCFNLFSQTPGDNDPSFNPTDFGFGTGDGPNGNIHTCALQSDGKVIVGGNFTTYNGISEKCMARLNANGTLDSTFASATSSNAAIHSVLIQPDGKILVAGYFSISSGPVFQGIKRLNADGSTDNSFTGSIGMYNFIKTMVLQPDGKIIIAGNFTTYNGISRNYISRLNTDGSLDMSFSIGSGLDNAIVAMVMQPDGKIVIGGYFTSYNGTTVNRIARLNADGSLDGTFNTGTGLNSIVTAIGVQPDGKILATGSFNSYNGANTGGLIRLGINGILDGTFTPIAGDIESISVQLDGKIIITGNFTGLNGVNKNRIGRLNTNGTTDATFNVGTGTDQQINSTILQSDGKVIIAGNFSAYNSLVRNKITRLNLNGSVDLTFVGVTGANSSVNKIVLESTGNIVVGGNFTCINGVNKNHIARFNSSGIFASSYPSTTGTNGNVYAMGTQQSTDKTVLAGGNFYEYNGVGPYSYLIGIDPTFGSLNSGWAVPWGWTASYSIYSLAVHNDGKITFGGNFFNYVGTNSYNIVRCYYDGSVDQVFASNASADNTVRAVLVQPDGKTIAGGDFTTCSGVSRNRITRLNVDGTSDPTFTVGLGVDNTISAMALQPDGKILIGGNFTSYNGVSRVGIARLNVDGTLDNTFTTGAGTNNTIKAITLQSDGKILIGGNFTNYDGVPRNCLARLNSDGTLDASFIVGSGANGIINTIAISANNNILIGGDFTSYNGAGRNRIAQIYSCITPTIANTTPAAALAICNGSNTKLTASSLGTISWYSSATSTVALSVGNTYITPTLSTGTYTYYAEATSCMNASTRLAIVVTVSSLTAPVITVNSGSVCPSSAFVMTPSGGITYTYTSGSATVNPSVTSYYYVTGKSANGCTNVVTSTVVVHPRPLITVNSGSICSGSSFTIIPSGANTYTYTGGSAIVSPTTNTTYNVTGTSTLGCVSASAAMSNVMVGVAPLMSVGNGTICTGNSFTISPSGATSYTYSSGSAVVTPTSNSTYTVTSNSYFNGCSNTKTVSVYVATPAISVNSITICSGQSFTITASGANTYTWSTGANTSSIVVTPSTNTIYTVTGTNVNGCVNTATASVTVNSEPTFTLSSLSETITCLNQVVGFSINTADSFVWSGPGVIFPSTTSASVTVNIPGIYTVTVNNGSCTNAGTVSVTINTVSTVVNIIPSVTSFCAGGNAVILANSTPTNSVSYLWDNAATTQSISVSPTVTTVYTATVTDNTNGCYASNSTTVTVYPLPTLTVTGTNTVCLGTSVGLISSGAMTYTWNTGTTTSSISVNPTTSTIYTVMGTDMNGCANTETVSITVDNTCADVWPGDANSDGVADNLDVLELGLHYTQTGAPRASTNNSWQSYFANNWAGTITNGKNLNHSDCNGDGIINDDDTLAIYTNYGLTHAFKPVQTTTVNPQLNIVPDQSMVVKGMWGTASIYLGDATNTITNINGIAFTVDFDNTLIEPSNVWIEYQNSFIDASQNLYFRKLDFANSKLFTASTHTVSNNVSGFGKIATLHYQISSALTTDQTLTLGVSQVSQSNASGNITPLTSGTGTLMAIGASVGVKENLVNANVLISPNPTNGLVMMQSTNDMQHVEVSNIAGQVLLQQVCSDKSHQLQLQNFAEGVYFVKVVFVNGASVVRKIVKQ